MLILQAQAMTAVKVAVERGRGWEPGQLRARLQALVDTYAGVPKEPVYTYEGGAIGQHLLLLCQQYSYAALNVHCSTKAPN